MELRRGDLVLTPEGFYAIVMEVKAETLHPAHYGVKLFLSDGLTVVDPGPLRQCGLREDGRSPRLGTQPEQPQAKANFAEIMSPA